MKRPLGAVLAVAVMLASVTVAVAEEPAKASLYDRLGGLAAISVVVSDFVDVLVPDKELKQNPAIAESRDRGPAAYPT
jgi:hemoglobin